MRYVIFQSGCVSTRLYRVWGGTCNGGVGCVNTAARAVPGGGYQWLFLRGVYRGNGGVGCGPAVVPGARAASGAIGFYLFWVT